MALKYPGEEEYRYLVATEMSWRAVDIASAHTLRWLIEDAFSIVKRLLGLAYFYCGAENAIEMQLWATWLLYAVLIDLTDAVAEALARPFADLSPEMVYRSLYFVTNAVAHDPTTDPVRYLADHARELGIIKRPRKKTPHERPPVHPNFPLDNQPNGLTCKQCHQAKAQPIALDR